MDYETIVYEQPAEGIARLVLNRPELANAQSIRMLYELNDGFNRAAQDDAIRVIILAANGKHFSGGHDLHEFPQWTQNRDQHQTVSTSAQHHRPGAEGRMSMEEEIYFGFCERWRNIPKITIAAVQGKCVSGGLMLAWPCDLIVASSDASFQEVTVALGVAGAEWFGYPFELGVRKAKEMLLTGEPISAEEARSLGMVNRVVPRDELEAATLALAEKIAAAPSFGTRMAKLAVNGVQDAQGRHIAMQNAFALHHLAHSHWNERGGLPFDTQGLHPSIRKTYQPKEEG